MIETVLPQDIEKRSFEIIREELETELDPVQAPIILRAIHTSADFSYAENLYFSEGVVEKAQEVLRCGATIVTDTQMALAGINKAALKKIGCEAICFIADEDVARKAKEEGSTRSAACVDKAARLDGPIIYAVGNAPTALLRLKEHIDAGSFTPEMIIGAPVGFVNVEASKEKIMQTEVPCIVARGRKGGSNIAAAIVNALLYQLTRD